ncbi:MAG: type II toxin-antitoxin system VapC family toxin [Candidatus Methanomethylicota archaeon]|uniref:Type II toxin-antitoxin system VapC family toxin n=1 Tax=Thermoproteota archaeon TaxID=2056631 RepID=A0A497EZ12_9CREN|nr:MAG: type II toxin-antitoxin system VapC family toxin [Candidatus Verstraetearchaeota archaeon]RLE52261.1 MAG: type II toxin-antitoxin system VapC family toxin [Candidatus Verstraetearchaeota archaeon]
MKLFDTSALIDMIREGRYETGYLSVITVIEFLRGVSEDKRDEVKKFLEESFKVLSIDNEVVKAYCKLYENLKSTGKPMPDADLLIASTAIAYELTLKTKNKHFTLLESLGLKLELSK